MAAPAIKKKSATTAWKNVRVAVVVVVGGGGCLKGWCGEFVLCSSRVVIIVLVVVGGG